MGNKWSTAARDQVDLYPLLDPSGKHGSWVPSFGDKFVVSIGKREDLLSLNGNLTYDERASYSIDLDLPQPAEVTPRSQLKLADTVSTSLDTLFSDTSFLKDLHYHLSQGSNAIAIQHGRLWGVLPSRRLAKALQDEGYVIPMYQHNPFVDPHPVIGQYGGRKRVPVNGFMISR